MESVAEVQARYPKVGTYGLGDTARSLGEVLGLVRSGLKRATCSTWAKIEGRDATSQMGRFYIVTTFDGSATLVKRTVELGLVRFCDMFELHMELIWKRFEVVEDLGAVNELV